MMLYCGDDPAAKKVAAQLATDLGFEPYDVGSLAEARLLEPFDPRPRLRRTRVTSRCQHDASGSIIRPVHLNFIQATLGDRLHDLDEVALESHEDGLRFGIAKANVVLKDLRPFFREHQANKEYAAKWKAFAARAGKRRPNDLCHHPVKHRRIQNARVGDCAHAAGIRPGIILADAFVIARRRH